MSQCCGDVFPPVIVDCAGEMRGLSGNERIRLGEQLLGLTFVYTDVSMTATTNSFLVANPVSGNITVTLPPAFLGNQMVVKNVHATNNVVIAGAGGDTIDGAASVTLSDENVTLTLTCDRNEWIVVGDGGGAGGGAGADGPPGGAVTMEYTFSTTTTDSDPGAGVLRVNNATQNTATEIYFDDLDINANDWGGFLVGPPPFISTIQGSLCYLRLADKADSSKFIVWLCTSVTDGTGYYRFFGTVQNSSSANPFANSDALIATLTLNGIDGADGAEGPPGSDAAITPGSFDNSIVRADGITNDTIQGSLSSIDDTGELTSVSLKAENTSITNNVPRDCVILVDNLAATVLSIAGSTASTGNAFIGNDQGSLLTSGTFNVGLGNEAGKALTTGASNSFFGHFAGRSISTGGTNTFVGRDCGNNASQLISADNSTAIGNAAFTTASNQVVLGNASVTHTVINGHEEIKDRASHPGAPVAAIHVYSHSSDAWVQCDNIVAGASHTQTTNVSSAILAGTTNLVTGCTSATVTGGQNHNVTTSDYAAVGGGLDNDIAGSTQSCITGGAGNTITDSQQSSICGGSTGTILNGRRSIIAGGLTNTITSPSANGSQSGVIVGGQSHTITSSTTASILGGVANIIQTGANNALIAAGANNTITQAPSSVIIGGSTNTIIAGSDFSTISGGRNNDIGNSDSSVIGGGNNNDITDSDAGVICGGQDNTITSAPHSSIVGGLDNEITTTGLYAVVGGRGAKATMEGELATASGSFVAAGDSQTSVLVLRRQTTNATQSTLRYSNLSSPNMPEDSCWAYKALVCGLSADGSEGAGFEVTGVARRDGAANAVLIGTPTVTVLGRNVGTWAVDNVVSTSQLLFRVTGEAAKTINWSCRLEFSQVMV